MKEKHCFVVSFLSIFLMAAFLGIIFSGGKNKKNNENYWLNQQPLQEDMSKTRPAAVAGDFYPADSAELKSKINDFLKEATIAPIEDFIKGLIVPHAGYDYSGPVAAYGFKALRDYFKTSENVSITIILLGASHHYFFEAAIIDGNDFWETPLGLVEIDKDLTARLTQQNSLFQIDSLYHAPEHCLEVEIPFLQTIFSKIKIVPILLGGLEQEQLESIAQTLAENADENTIFVASTDLSHYPRYEDANYVDQKTIKAVLSGDNQVLQKTIQVLENENIAGLETCMCGQQAVAVLLQIMNKLEADNIKLLKYANSGDREIGDKSQVVGYASIIFSSKRKGAKLNQQEQSELLKIARQSVESYLKTGAIPNFQSNSFFLNKKQGAFVTLKNNGQLRGCIGALGSDLPLWQAVSQMAVSAAVNDNRFMPVEIDELEELEYEISVLSPLKKIKDWQEIEIGKDGVQIIAQMRSGVFLPQVATENNWNKEEFLRQLCQQKLGLEPTCYQRPDAELYVFGAQVFK